MSPGRLQALIDGVFAIAMTLLVLDLPHPGASQELAHDLEVHWDAYVAYLISFATLGIVWIEHHGMMGNLHETNRRFIERTLAFLLFVAVIPWPTSLAASFADEAASAELVAILYAAAMFMMAITLAWSWGYLHKHPDLVFEQARPQLAIAYRRRLLATAPYLAAIVVAVFSPLTSFVLDAAVVVYLALSRNEPAVGVDRASGNGE